MSATYKVLNVSVLETDATYRRPCQALPEQVELASPALDVMTDLTRVTAVSINPCAGLEEARERMIASGVQLLFVTNQFHQVLGIITKTDLSGQKAVNYVSEVGGKIDELMVRDIMTPRHRLEVLDYQELTRSRVGDVVTTMKRMGRQHALVVETDDGQQFIRGVLSTTQLSKQLGDTITTSEYAGSFADMASKS